MTIDTSRVEAVVLGGSAGAFAGLRQLLPALPPTLRVPVVIVLHQPQDRPSAIVDIFGRGGVPPVKEIDDKEPLAPGIVFFAPPGYHLLIESTRTAALTVDEPVHFSRPSIDVLFESAAEVFGSALIGIILSGANQDGAAGLGAIERAGGIAMIQSPDSAEHPAMPQAAVAATTAAHVLSIDDIAAALATLAAPAAAPQARHTDG